MKLVSSFFFVLIRNGPPDEEESFKLPSLIVLFNMIFLDFLAPE